MIILVKFETHVKMYIVVTRYLLKVYTSRRLSKYLNNQSIYYINKPQYLVRPFLALIVYLRLLSMLYTNFSLSICL